MKEWEEKEKMWKGRKNNAVKIFKHEHKHKFNKIEYLFTGSQEKRFKINCRSEMYNGRNKVRY